MRKILISIFLCQMLLTSCTIYRIDIQQGNTLEAEQVNQLKVGMTSQQVQYLLGTPLLRDPFHHNRWDYIYLLRKNREIVARQRVTLYFEEETLVRIDDTEFKEKQK